MTEKEKFIEWFKLEKAKGMEYFHYSTAGNVAWNEKTKLFEGDGLKGQKLRTVEDCENKITEEMAAELNRSNEESDDEDYEVLGKYSP